MDSQLNQLAVSIYLISFVSVLGATLAFFYSMMVSTLKDFDEVNNPRRRRKTVLPAPHPEMEGVKYGEELLVFKGEVEELEEDT